MSSGFHRIHLRSADGDHVTAYLPLDEQGRFDKQGPQPWLVKSVWGGYEHVGELTAHSATLHRLSYAELEDQLTDFGTAPIKPGSIVRIYDADDIAAAAVYEFTVLDVRRV